MINNSISRTSGSCRRLVLWLTLLVEIFAIRSFLVYFCYIYTVPNYNYITISKFAISQSEAVSTVLISCDIKSLIWYGCDVMLIWPNMSTIKTLSHLFGTLRWHVIGSFGLAWSFRLDYPSQKYEPWLDQTRQICHRSEPKRWTTIMGKRLGTNLDFWRFLHTPDKNYNFPYLTSLSTPCAMLKSSTWNFTWFSALY